MGPPRGSQGGGLTEFQWKIFEIAFSWPNVLGSAPPPRTGVPYQAGWMRNPSSPPLKQSLALHSDVRLCLWHHTYPMFFVWSLLVLCFLKQKFSPSHRVATVREHEGFSLVIHTKRLRTLSVQTQIARG